MLTAYQAGLLGDKSQMVLVAVAARLGNRQGALSIRTPWLADVLARINDHKIPDLAALLPWRWGVEQAR